MYRRYAPMNRTHGAESAQCGDQTLAVRPLLDIKRLDVNHRAAIIEPSIPRLCAK